MFKNKFFIASLIAILTIAVFSPALKLGFVNFDDRAHLINNPATFSLSPSALQLAWTQHVQKIYIPLTTLSFAIERSLFGLNPFVFHLDNVLLHAANSVLVFVIALRFNIPIAGAFLAAAIFALHPMRVESVAWVTERKDVLCAFFYFLACLQWIIYRQQGRRLAYFLAHIFTALSILAKPMAISLPLAFFCIDWFLLGKLNRKIFIDKIFVFVICAGLGWVTYQEHVRNPIENVWSAIQLWVSCAMFYWQKFFVPVSLSPIYPIPEGHQLFQRFILSLAALGGIFYLACAYRNNRLWIFALLFYAVTIFFVLRFDARSDINWVADRFMYIPSIGLCLWLGDLLNKKKILGVIILIVLGALTWRLIPIWKDSISLWDHVLKVSPQELLAYTNRADAYVDFGLPNKAVDDYSKVIKLLGILPSKNIISRISDGKGGEQVIVKIWHLNATEVKFNRALALFAAKRFDEAIEDFNEVATHYPHYDAAYYHRGLCFESKGERGKALEDYAKCVEINPGHSECFAAQGNVYSKLGQWYDALAAYNKSLKVNPVNARVYNNRAIVYLALGMEDKGLADFNESIKHDARYGEAYFNRSVQYFMRKDYKGAVEDMIRASELGVIIPDKYYQDLKSSLDEGVI